MSREIKFRAWVLKDGKMIQHRNRAPAVKMFTQDYAYTNKEVIVMQYTGLLDKNGTEVYEGDIVTDMRAREIYQVIFSEGDDIGCNAGEYYNWVYGFVPAHADGSVDDSGRCEFMYEQMILGRAEVIGNIYEHPHLLKEREE